VRSGERPLHALRERGVEYVEVRAMDLDPFSAIGITEQTVLFLDVFLLHCLLSDSPPDTPREIGELGRNKQRVAASGREPGLRLDRNGQTIEFVEWAAQLLAECATTAKALDDANGTDAHRKALSAAVEAVNNPALVPSARVLGEIGDRYDGSFHRFALAHSLEHRRALLAEPLAAELGARYERMGTESLEEQAMIEAADRLPFETFRQQYLSPDSLRAG
jgi:glutamate--cysteine ligase